MRILLSLLFTLSSFGFCSYAQVERLRVPLHSPSSSFEGVSSNTILSLQTDTCLSCYEGISKKIKEAVVKTHAFDYTNYIYQMHREKKLSDSTFNKLEKMYSLSSLDYWPSKINSKIKILYGIGLDNSPIYVFDTNNDSSFIGETIYNQKELKQLRKLKIRNIEAVINGKLTKESVFINIDIDGCKETFDNPFVEKWKLCALIKHDKTGYLATKDFRRDIVASNDTYYGFKYYPKGTKIYLLDPSNKNRKTEVTPYKVGDTIYTYSHNIKIEAIDTLGNFIDFSITRNKDRVQYGFNEGSFVKPAVYVNQVDLSSLNFGDYKGKYIFLDFWGTWCVPCKTVNPQVLDFKSKIEKSSFKDSIIFINIAWEYSQPANYKEQVNKYYNGWNSVLEFQEQKTGVVKQLHINSFPTFMLLSPTHKILLRKSGADQFESFAHEVKGIIK